jgi:hypothetical protein
VAPGGRHMRVVRGRDGAAIALGDDPPVNFCKPAVDPLFSSAAQVWGAGSWRSFSPAWAPTARAAPPISRRRRQRDRAGRSDQRGVGHAALGRQRRLCSAVLPLGEIAAKVNRFVRRRSRVTPLDYDFLRKCLKERSGLVLSADKQYLVESRLAAGRAQGRPRRPRRTRGDAQGGADR